MTRDTTVTNHDTTTRVVFDFDSSARRWWSNSCWQQI